MSAGEQLYRAAPVWLQTVMLNAYAVRIQRERYGAAFDALQREWDRSERWSPEQLREWQDRRVREIVRTAYATVPFYRERYEQAGVHPDYIRGVDDLVKLPVVTKEDIRAAGEDMQNVSLRGKLVHGHTSGTTGSPLSLWYDKGTCTTNAVADWRQKRWAGMTTSDWCGVFLGRVVVPPTQRGAPYWRANHVHKQLWFSSFHMTDETLDAYVSELKRRRIQFIEGYPSTMYILARHLVRRGETLQLRGVFTSSETLHEAQRETMQAAFSCPVHDFYGMAERVIFAGECEMHDGKHLFDEYGVTEVLDDAGNRVPDGERGWLVGTSLWNVGMPLIRYRTSDISAKLGGQCACGRTLGRISGVTTKAEDIVLTPDGRFISPSILTHPFKPFDQLLKSQVIQESIDQLRVKLVPSTEFTDEHQQQLVAGLRERLGDGMRIDVEIVPDLPPEKSGKFRWVISRVQHGCTIEQNALA